MKEYKKLREISKDVLSKEHHKKVDSLCCLEDKKDALRFMILSQVKMRHLEIEDLLKESDNHRDFHVLSLKLSNIPHKITLLQDNLEEKDFKKILALLDEIELRLLNNGLI